ncbi:hypothetical protein EON65_07520 [archaeon]|nr:MAG: hypothetical protein EON65_07520 [archaeon]
MSETAVAVVERDIETLEEPKSTLPIKTIRDASVKTRLKLSREIKWSGVNFRVGDKKILSDCWGQVNAP